jgi:hypothetical protein
MAGRWSLHLFDWARYSELAPGLMAACVDGDFDEIDDDEAQSILAELHEDADTAEICNSLLLELCVTAESAIFDTRLPAVLLWLRKQSDAEDAAETIASLIFQNPNIEDWFACELGLVGLFTVDEVSALEELLAGFKKRYKPPKKQGGILAITRLFATSEAYGENIEDLLAIVSEAAERRAGLAAVLEE